MDKALICGRGIKSVAIMSGLLAVSIVILTRPTMELKSLKVSVSEPQHHEEKRVLNHKGDSNGVYLSGIDVSHYQGNIDWVTVAKQDVHFVYLKATDGITYTDPSFHRNQKSVIEQSIPIGAYHFFEPHDDGVKQAENFLAQLKIHDNMLPPVLDIEQSKGVKKELLQKRVQQWIDTVEKKVGCQPVIYSYGSFYNEYLGEKFSKYRLWLADYAQKPTLPHSVKQWFIWQHSQSGHVKGISTLVDSDKFRGRKDQLTAMLCSR